jgi:Ser/Thr protein kinase RdoA (MazF antagonist)
VRAFAELTYLGQVRRLRRLAESAIRDFGLEGARLSLVNHGENTTYRVDVAGALSAEAASSPYVGNRYLLRIHRTGYQSGASIISELAWLSALRREARLPVPEPVPSPAGELLVTASAPGIPEPRRCSLLRWLKGRFCRRSCEPRHLRAVGRLTARLHHHAEEWQLPAGFARRHWNWEGLFGDGAGFYLDSHDVWGLLPPAVAGPFHEVAGQMRQLMLEWGQGPDAVGLIHADLHMDNVLFWNDEARPIDFDDCGFGYRIYDLATALSDWQGVEEWPRLREALLEGYAQIHPLPQAQLAQLDLFMAARHVSLMLWATDMAQVNPNIRRGLPQWLESAADHVRRYLDGEV